MLSEIKGFLLILISDKKGFLCSIILSDTKIPWSMVMCKVLKSHYLKHIFKLDLQINIIHQNSKDDQTINTKNGKNIMFYSPCYIQNRIQHIVRSAQKGQEFTFYQKFYVESRLMMLQLQPLPSFLPIMIL